MSLSYYQSYTKKNLQESSYCAKTVHRQMENGGRSVKKEDVINFQKMVASNLNEYACQFRPTISWLYRKHLKDKRG